MSFARFYIFARRIFPVSVRKSFAFLVRYILALESIAIAFSSSNTSEFCFAAFAKSRADAVRSSSCFAVYSVFTSKEMRLFRSALEELVEIFVPS